MNVYCTLQSYADKSKSSVNERHHFAMNACMHGQNLPRDGTPTMQQAEAAAVGSNTPVSRSILGEPS